MTSTPWCAVVALYDALVLSANQAAGTRGFEPRRTGFGVRPLYQLS